MKLCTFLFFICAVGATTATSSGSTSTRKILVLGDSFAEYSGDTFTKFCKGAQEVHVCGVLNDTRVVLDLRSVRSERKVTLRFSRVWQINQGIGGTTAVQWTKSTMGTSYPKAVQAAGALGPNDVVVFSLGGNE